jgi:ankyrin repeat protein
VLLREDDSLAVALVDAIHTGDIEALQGLLAKTPGLANAQIRGADDDGGVRSPLHVATDWPGCFPNCAASIAALIAAGGDVNARFAGGHTETPLHWAASSDDVAALDALLDGGADIEAEGAVIAGGTPLADAVAFRQWRAAQRLIERGARVTFWQAAALGLMERVTAFFADGAHPNADEITSAFWCACHGDRRDAADYLLARGAELNWVGYDHLTPLDAARRVRAHELAEWLRERGAKSAKEIDDPTADISG